MTTVSKEIGEVSVYMEQKLPLKLRKSSLVETVFSTAKIENNPLDKSEVETIIAGKKVRGDRESIDEIINLHSLYENLSVFNPTSERDFLKVHSVLTQNVLRTSESGKYRKVKVGIRTGRDIKYIAPDPMKVKELMKLLFKSIDSNSSPLIEACRLHYEIERIHPFVDGNGRIGRFWQTLYLYHHFDSVFQFIPIESLIYQNQAEYYRVLRRSDEMKDCSIFIEFILKMILESCKNIKRRYYLSKDDYEQRIKKAKSVFKKRAFSRKEYVEVVETISAPMATKDLRRAVDEGILEAKGDMRNRVYRFL